MREIWKSIRDYEGYYKVSNYGRVKSLSRFNSKTERILIGETDKRKYRRVRLSRENTTKKYQIHRLEATVFIPNPENKPQVNHINGIKSDNRVENLEWCTPSENMKHAFNTGLQSLSGEKNTQSKLTEKDVKHIRIMLYRGIMHKVIANLYNVSRHCITDINTGKTWANI